MASSLYDYDGPAFPTDIERNGLLERHPGMTLRDYFAGQALIGLLAMCAGEHIKTGTPQDAAAYAYEHADAMLAEREK